MTSTSQEAAVAVLRAESGDRTGIIDQTIHGGDADQRAGDVGSAKPGVLAVRQRYFFSLLFGNVHDPRCRFEKGHRIICVSGHD